MKKTFLGLISLFLSASLHAQTFYNQFYPGGALSGTWNSQSIDLSAATFLNNLLGVTKGGTGLASGTSGGILYFSNTTAIASSSLLTSGALVLGGGAGTAPLTDADLVWNTSTNILTLGNVATPPTITTTTGSSSAGAALTLSTGGGNGTNQFAGALTLQPGLSTGTAAGSLLTITGSTASSGRGGNVNITAGTSNNLGGGGTINIAGGAGNGVVNINGGNGIAGASNGNGGEIFLTGGNAVGSGDPGAIIIKAGDADTTANGEIVNITSGNGGSVSGNAGDFNFTAGSAFGSGTGGNLNLVGGNAAGTLKNGGDITMSAGFGGTVSGNGGRLLLASGPPSNTGSNGIIDLQVGGTSSFTSDANGNFTAAQALQIGAPTGGFKGTGTLNSTGLYINNVQIKTVLSGTTGSIGGGALLAGACASGTITITGATTSMVAVSDPNTYPGDGATWSAQVTSANTITERVCAIIALTPTASTYNVRVIQ